MSLSHLSHLSSAPNKSSLAGLLNRTVMYLPTIHPSPYPPAPVSSIMTSFDLNANAQESLYLAMRKFCSLVLSQHTSASDTSSYIRELLSASAKDLDPKLVELLVAVVPNLCQTWRAASLKVSRTKRKRNPTSTNIIIIHLPNRTRIEVTEPSKTHNDRLEGLVASVSDRFVSVDGRNKCFFTQC